MKTEFRERENGKRGAMRVEVCMNLRHGAEGGLEPVGELVAESGEVDVKSQAEGAMPEAGRSTREALRLEAVEAGAVSVGVAGRTLKGTYTRRSMALTDADLEWLERAVEQATLRGADRAGREGLGVGATIARWKLTDREGRVMQEGMPAVMLSQTTGSRVAMGARVTASGEQYKEMEAGELRLPAFRLRLSAPGGITAAVEDGSRVEIWSTPILIPLMEGGSGEGRLEQADSEGCTVTMTIPGTGGSDYRRQTRGMVTAAMERLSVMEERIATVEVAELREAGSTVTVDATGKLKGRKALRAAIKALEGDAPRGMATARALQGPGAFEAATGTVAGEVAAWGDLTTNGVKAPLPTETGAGDADSASKSWRGWVAVSESDEAGNSGMSVAGGAWPGMPLKAVGPMVAVASTQARELTVKRLTSGGATESVTLALSPAGESGWSISVDDELRPRELKSDGTLFVEPAGRPLRRRMAGTVAIARRSRPTEIVKTVTASEGRVVKVTPAPRGVNTLEGGRTSLYALTDEGIKLLTLSRSLESAGLTTLDTRGIADGALVAMTEKGVRAVAAGKVLEASGSRVTEVATLTEEDTARQPVMAGHSTVTAETWLADAEGRVTVVNGEGRFDRDDVKVSGMVQRGDRLWVKDAAGRWLRAWDERPREATAVKWRGRTETLESRKAVKRLAAAIAASKTELTVRVKGDGGAGSAEAVTLLELEVKGALNYPLSEMIAGPAMPSVTVETEGTMSADGKLLNMEY